MLAVLIAPTCPCGGAHEPALLCFPDGDIWREHLALAPLVLEAAEHHRPENSILVPGRPQSASLDHREVAFMLFSSLLEIVGE